MDSIGEKLRTAREKLSFTIDQVARDTHITKRFLEALEEENFEIFPGESYLIGFMRNYADYLGLNSSEVTALYKNMKIQEEPTPINELVKKPLATGWKIVAIATTVVLFVVGIALIAGIPAPDSNTNQPINNTAQNTPEENEVDGIEHSFSEEFLEKVFYENANIVVNLDELSYGLRITEIGEEISFKSGEQEFQVPLNTQELIDLDQDGDDDIAIQVKSVNLDVDPAQAIIRFDRAIGSLPAIANTNLNDSSGSELNLSDLPSIGSAQSPERQRPVVELLTQEERDEFYIEVTFTGPTLFRYVTEEGLRQENFVKAQDTFRIGVKDYIRIWLADASKANTRIAGQPVQLGRDGEVNAFQIEQSPNPNPSGQFAISIVPMY